MRVIYVSARLKGHIEGLGRAGKVVKHGCVSAHEGLELGQLLQTPELVGPDRRSRVTLFNLTRSKGLSRKHISFLLAPRTGRPGSCLQFTKCHAVIAKSYYQSQYTRRYYWFL